MYRVGQKTGLFLRSAEASFDRLLGSAKQGHTNRAIDQLAKRLRMVIKAKG